MNLKKELNPHKLHIIPFGGCGEFGMNMTAYIIKRKLFIVDAGVLFPEPQHLGVASIIPAAKDLIAAFGKVEAYLITHGHEDHIGALPYFYRDWPAPIYASPWTVALIKKKFSERGLKTDRIRTVRAGQAIVKPPLKVEFIHVNHSIPDATSLFLTTPGASVFHTGDFKIDPEPVGTPPVDLRALRKIGDSGVSLLIADSTNAHSPGPSPSESSVVAPLENLIAQARGRVFITTFASNLWRLKNIVEICVRLKKRLLVLGRGIITCLELGAKHGFLQWPENLLISEDKASSVPEHKLVVLVSGSQAESRSALSRLAQDGHRHLTIKKKDLVVFSARMIPGNEKGILALIDLLKKQGARVITTKDLPAIHVSGHAYEEDLKTFIRCLRPAHYLPVHGSFSHLQSNVALGEKMRYHGDKRTLIANGDILQLGDKETRVIGKIEIGHEYIDQDADTPMSWEVLRERTRIGELGMALVTGIFSQKLQAFTAGPDIELFGLSLPHNMNVNSWLEDARLWLEEQLDYWLGDNAVAEAEVLEEKAHLFMRRYLQVVFRKKPIVLVKIYMR